MASSVAGAGGRREDGCQSRRGVGPWRQAEDGLAPLLYGGGPEIFRIGEDEGLVERDFP